MQNGIYVRHHLRWRWVAAIGTVAALVGLLLVPSGRAVAQPGHAVTASEARGCCLCRGTAGSDANALRSCSDGVGVEECVDQCRTQNADSLAFGYEQNCSEGCAGFPTQSLD